MARKLRLDFEGAIYHVTVRGVGRRRLFDDDRDRERFLKRMGDAVEELGVRLYLYCLMTNHVHLLVETPQANLSRFMHKIQTAYTVYYNLRHGRSGHLMQGRFGAKVVDGDAYLLALSRYIHLNPVFVGGAKVRPFDERVARLRAYTWSSYRGYAGLCEPASFVVEGPLLAMVEAAERKRRQAYGRYVEAGLLEKDQEFLEVLSDSRWGIGDDAFQEGLREWHVGLTSKARRVEDVSFRRTAASVPAVDVIAVVASAFAMPPEDLRRRNYGCVAQSVAARMLIQYSGMLQRDIASLMGMQTGAAICQRIANLKARTRLDADLASRLRTIEKNLDVIRLQRKGIV